MLLTIQRWIWCFAILAVSTTMGNADEQNGNLAPAIYEQPIRAELASDGKAVSGRRPVNGGLADEPLPLNRSQSPTNGDTQPTTRSESPVLKTLGSLAVVMGIFSIVVYFVRRTRGQSGHILPTDVLEVLGRTSLNNRHYVQLIRLGDRLLLVSVSASGTHTLTEITQPEEVERLANACNERHGRGSILRTAIFSAIPRSFSSHRERFGDTGLKSDPNSEYAGSHHG